MHFDSPDNTFDLSIDGKSVKAGSLLEDFEPAVNPPKEIGGSMSIAFIFYRTDSAADDANDKKPEEWVEEARISDPEASKVDFTPSS